jgi:hypothetical protein
MRLAKLAIMSAVVFGGLVGAGSTMTTAVRASAADVPAERVPEATKQAKMQRLRAAALAVIVYVNRNDSHFPVDLGSSLKYADEKLGARAFLTKEDEQKTSVPDYPNGNWVNQHTSFTYLANSSITWKALDSAHVNTPEFPLACEKLDGIQGEVAVAFIDGHAEMMSIDKARKVVDDARKIYEKLR